MMVKIEGILTEKDGFAASRLHRRWWWLLIAMTITGFLGSVAYLLFLDRAFGLVITPIYAAVLALLLWLPRYKVRNQYRQMKALREPVRVELREDGLFFSRTHAQQLLPWDHIRKVRGNETVILIYPSSYTHHILPRHFFECQADYDVFLKTLRQHVGE